MKRAYFFDIDGTLYYQKYHEVSPRCMEQLKRIKAQNDYIGLCTSRCLQELSHLPKCLRTFPFDVYILDGGALMLDQNLNIIQHHPMSLEKMEKVDSYCKEHGIVYRYSTKDGNYWATPPDLKCHRIWMDLYLTTPDFKPYEQENAYNLLVMTTDLKHQKYFYDLFENKGIVRYPDCLEIRMNGLDKAISVQEYKKLKQIDQTICFGDGENDILMLKQADIGVAMGNAKDVVKKEADVVLDEIERDPIYYYLKEEL